MCVINQNLSTAVSLWGKKKKKKKTQGSLGEAIALSLGNSVYPK